MTYLQYNPVIDMPDLNFFIIGEKKGIDHRAYLFCTFELSLGLKSIMTFGFKNVYSISMCCGDEAMRRLNAYYRDKLYFAESNKSYLFNTREQYDEFKEDYLIVKLSGVTQ